MKFFATAATFAFIATVAHAECGVVRSEVRPSKQNALATVMMDGKAAKHLQLLLQIHLFPDGTESELELTTDARGNIDLKNLHVGRNCLTAHSATGDTRWTGSMCLDVIASPNSTPTKFPFVLSVLTLEPPSMDEVLREKEKLPIELSVPAFAGTVKDMTGALVPKADISIYRRDIKAKTDPVKVKTDGEGAFAVPLGAGTYTVVIMEAGFKIRYMELEIKKDAPIRNIAIELNIGDVC